jgi:hypothetical protein
MRRLLLLLAALGVIAGCSTAVAGAPSPEVGAAAQPTKTNAITLPPRPRELKLDGIDPCSSLKPPQLAKLGLDNVVPSITTGTADLDSRICTAIGLGAKRIGASIAFVTRPGISYITEGPTASFGDFEQMQIAGFPSITEPQQKSDTCTVDVDVAAGQFINIFYQDENLPAVLSRVELCQGANAVGEEVMKSLLSE